MPDWPMNARFLLFEMSPSDEYEVIIRAPVDQSSILYNVQSCDCMGDVEECFKFRGIRLPVTVSFEISDFTDYRDC